MQASFATALVEPRLPAPPDIVQCGGTSGVRNGFAVYRNNSLATLIDALHERFPVTCQLVGKEFFRAMARVYAGEHRPHSPLLMQYGHTFPAFIAGFGPAENVPYLSDVARLEALWSEAYHSPDATPLEPSALSSIEPDALIDMYLVLHPSTRILRAAYPVADIWVAHQNTGVHAPLQNWDPQDVLVVRPEADVQIHTLGPGILMFLSALLDRRSIADAAALALLDNEQFNLGRAIVDLFGIGAVVAFETA